MISDDLKLQDIEGWMAPEALQWLYEMAMQHRRGIEIGCFMGRSTCALAAGLKASFHGQLHVVDTFDGRGTSRHEEFKDPQNPADNLLGRLIDNLRARGLTHLVMPYCGDSNDPRMAARFLDDFSDFLFIDASHDKASVLKDLELWTPKVRKGGVICGHDYHETWPSVVEAVDQFFVGRAIAQHPDGLWSVTA